MSDLEPKSIIDAGDLRGIDSSGADNIEPTAEPNPSPSVNENPKNEDNNAKVSENKGNEGSTPTQQTIQEYDLVANGLEAHITIYKTVEEFVPIYGVSFKGVSMATRLLLLSMRRPLLTSVPVDLSKINDKDYVSDLNKRYLAAAEVLIDRYLPRIEEGIKKVLLSYILNMMLGLGELEVPLSDDSLEEITVNGANYNIWVFHKKLGWLKTSLKPTSEDSIYNQAEQIGRRVGREINNLTPLMDAELEDGSRVNGTLFPISQSGNTLTIRKFSKNPWTMPALIKNGSLDANLASLVWLCIQNEISVLISGGTASGKTSFLNAMSIFFPSNRRVISVEDTRELALPNFLQWVPMITREPNPEGKGAVSMYDLMINSLRQRPDIIVVGEIRAAEDAQTLFEAIHTGHSVYGTLHADNVQDTIIRMTNPPINTPKISMNALGVIITVFRHRAKGIRRVLEFGELLRTGDANVLYRWNIRTDTFTKVSEMTRLQETLNLYTGMTKSEIDSDVKEKSDVLSWMAANNITNVDDAGFVIANYYNNRERVLDIVKENAKFSRDKFK
ncbi:type II secretion system ATPase GspE [Candidatus Mancarchaeum acidiphilum]|uniref:Type II secretion system ATPase GspE n=1 Tax=Candidatus Mancarchaeum acidiphilum TaxID=1920749 RepID=A0A218NM18_9ARCH|nr:ATPase, T2SS/T4P/T4SS family [Candidatus Mancarchaeum acidiphilum]ASI13506.1 type II secretion system ATPase GspE [Candidatus Mancarchaeum acidiphilum]